MKILFICGALEQGKDGVGDYTRRLAGELIRQGHDAAIIAYNDRQIETVIDGEQADEGTAINILRLPAALKAKDKVKSARDYVVGFQPDWISLQFVIYSFHSKGLPFFLGRQLRQIGHGYKWHIMFHELWIGTNLNNNDTYKAMLIGRLQKHCIQNILALLNPQLVHTQSTIHLALLQNLINPKLMVKKLNLFGNIPVLKNTYHSKYIQKETIDLFLFGTIRKCKNLTDFIKWLKEAQGKSSSLIRIHFIGKNGAVITEWEHHLKKQDISYTVHGFQDLSSLSLMIADMDIGLSTTPYALSEKSGAAAAMLEHDIPVLSIGDNWANAGQIDTPVINWEGELDFQSLIKIKASAENSVQQVAKLFVNDIIHSTDQS